MSKQTIAHLLLSVFNYFTGFLIRASFSKVLKGLLNALLTPSHLSSRLSLCCPVWQEMHRRGSQAWTSCDKWKQCDGAQAWRTHRLYEKYPFIKLKTESKPSILLDWKRPCRSQSSVKLTIPDIILIQSWKMFERKETVYIREVYDSDNAEEIFEHQLERALVVKCPAFYFGIFRTDTFFQAS